MREWIGEHGPTVVGGSLAGAFTYVIWGAVDQGQATCTGYFCEAGPILFGRFIAPVVVLAIVWAVIGIGSYRGAGIAGIAAAIALIDGPTRLRLGAGAGVGACLLTIAIGAVAGPVYNGGFASFRDILLRPSPARFTVIAGVAYPTEGYVLLKVVAKGSNDPVALIESRRPDVWDPPDRCGAPVGRSDPSEVQPCEPYEGGGYQRGSGEELLDTHGVTLVETQGWVINGGGSLTLMRDIITSLEPADPSDFGGLPVPDSRYPR
jgi:hypothetical protein